MADDQNLLKARIAAAKQRQQDHEQNSTSRRAARIAGKEMGVGMKVGTTLFASIITGLLLGFGIDHLAGSRPFGLIACLLLAMVAGIREVWKTLKRIEAEAEARRNKQPDTADR